MSYDNNQCPCGEHKPTGTMLCDACVDTFKDRRELQEYQDGKQSLEYRRRAAIILLSLVRGRNTLKVVRSGYK